jgi:SulP family sulfate permease
MSTNVLDSDHARPRSTMIDAALRIGLIALLVTCWLVGLNPSVLEYIRASGFADRLGPERLFSNVRAAIEHYTGDFRDTVAPPVQNA